MLFQYITLKPAALIKNYLKTAFRSFQKNKHFSIINLSGLAIGLTCFILISVYVLDELSYDRYARDTKDIYRVHLGVTGNGEIAEYPNVDFAVGQGFKDAFPEIKSFVRLSTASDFVKFGEFQAKESRLAFADSNFLDFFSIPLIEGGTNALSEPNTIIISRAFANKYFGNETALGKSLIVGLRDAQYKVTGVFDEMPSKSHFHFDAVMSMSTFHITHPTWSNLGFFTYIKLENNVDPKQVQARFPELVAQHVVPEVQHDMGVSLAEAQKTVNTFIFSLVPLKRIHLYSHTKYEIEPGGDIQYVYIFSALAVFILLLACINFTNLAIARSVQRAKEVGVRKVLGSGKKQLVRQFLFESVLMTFGAMILALIIIFLILPYFNQVSGKQISIDYFLDVKFIISIIALLVVVGIIAGYYPSFFLSALQPIKILKGVGGSISRRNPLRSGLVIFQFAVSTALTVATLVVYNQLQFMQHKKLGFDKEQLLVLPDGRLMGDKQDAFRQELLSDKRVVSASISRSVPGDLFMDGTEVYPVNQSGNGTEIHMNIYHVDYDYASTLGLRVTNGRYFSKEFGTDSSAVVINAAAAKALGWQETNAVGGIIARSGQQRYSVIGVLEDFHYASAKHKVAPLMLVLGGNYGGFIVKVKTPDMHGFLGDLKSKWNSFHPKGPLNYSFIDEKFAALYASEQRTQQIFFAFAILSIIIAALGLFGLSAFMIDQRTKEIGIRKVLGASTRTILVLVSREFFQLILIAFVIAAPLTYWAMNNWLQNYAYRTYIGGSVFVIAACTAFFIAALTISFQAIKAAWKNPVTSLRTE